jgi:hypothetical protein
VKMENSDWRMENVRMEIYSLLRHHSKSGRAGIPVSIFDPPRGPRRGGADLGEVFTRQVPGTLVQSPLVRLVRVVRL